ncbi:MAG: hypothetical protein WCO10_01015 [bacterium]
MLELTSAIILLASSIYSAPNIAIAQDLQNNNTDDAKVLTVNRPVTLEAHVKEYFNNEPILADIAFCESTYRQLDSNGKILRGVVNKDDVGLMQINEFYHKDTAKKLGLDLRTVDGNLGYAKYLYEKEGTKPWKSSAKCWTSLSKANGADKELAINR